MEIYIRGLASGYEPEHVARLFFQPALLAKRWPARGADAVAVLRGKKRFVCGVRMNGLCVVRTAPLAQDTPPEQAEYEICRLLFLLLCEATGRRPAWGMLTGVRPVRLVHDMRRAGKAPEEIESFFRDKYFADGEKYKLAVRTADNQAPVLALNTPRSYSLYISIPFCPSRCSYCSFVSRTTAESGSLIEPYVQALCRELAEISALARRNRLRLETIYIGGGTPTAVSAAQLRTLMQAVRDNFDVPAVREYTVEAGRPDCTTPEKLAVIKEYGATRISINPQTFEDEVLAHIGRRHTAEDIRRCFYDARQAGHRNINMDLIAGLPGDTEEGFARSLEQAIALEPENITVHTLTLKRASSLVIDHSQEDYADVAAMLEHCDALNKAGYVPYYLYRQKNTLQNLENIGWCKPGYEGYYNIYIMEEVHSILSAGAGGSTKLRQPGCGEHIERIFNYKYANEYINGFDVILERKRGIGEFYGRYLDSQTSG